MTLLALQSGLAGALGQAAVLAGTLVLLLAIVGLGAFAYRSLRGDGIEWPEDVADSEDDEDGDGLREGDSDDEWDYY